MVCILALLFPVISLTDDLHPETVAVDAASGKRNACLIAASASHMRSATVGSGTQSILGLNSRPIAAVNLIFSEFASTSKLHNSSYLASNSPGRSPPSFL